MTFLMDFVIESAAIEGQTIPESEVEGSKHYEAAQYAMDLAKRGEVLTEQDIKNMQRLIVSEQSLWGDRALWPEDLGAYRTGPIGLMTASGSIIPIGCEPGEIQEKMDELLEFIRRALAGGEKQQRDGGMNPLAAYAHLAYERIHPFVDGNGRSGRLVALYMLAFMGEPPVLFTNSDKAFTYYPCFREPTDELMRRYFMTHRVGVE